MSYTPGEYCLSPLHTYSQSLNFVFVCVPDTSLGLVDKDPAHAKDEDTEASGPRSLVSGKHYNELLSRSRFELTHHRRISAFNAKSFSSSTTSAAGQRI